MRLAHDATTFNLLRLVHRDLMVTLARSNVSSVDTWGVCEDIAYA